MNFRIQIIGFPFPSRVHVFFYQLVVISTGGKVGLGGEL